ncbi:PEP-CTERM sorting domain-containing protein [bacterium]|nr:MAG: PEP-CTERM sorting domain-containing protein [bacterium]
MHDMPKMREGLLPILSASMKRSLILLSLLATAAVSSAVPVPITVSYTVSGAAGDYTLDFTLTNSSGHAPLGLYFFGVSTGSLLDTPSAFGDNGTWNPFTYGGSGPDITHASTWITNPYGLDRVWDGASLSGFKVSVTDLVIPTSINWFAYGVDETSTYDGHGSFNGDAFNPGFAGTITTQAVPEPASMAALSLGGLALLRRRRKNA